MLLEIKLPREIDRSPAAMEMVLESMWEDVAGSFTDIFMNGAVRNWFSLEIAAIHGEVRFFIWTWPKWRHVVETRFYAQYPNAEIQEVDDYALNLHFKPGETKVGGITTSLVKEDVIPMKTYVDFELDRSEREQEQIIDPLLPVIEYLGSLGPDEFACVQILIQGHRDENFTKDIKIAHKKKHFSRDVKDAIKKIVKDSAYFETREDYPPSTLNLTKSQNEAIASIERNAAKHAYDAMLRLIFVVPADGDNKVGVAGMIGAMRQFGFVGKNTVLNGIRPKKFIPGINYPWEDFLNIKKNRNQRLHLEAFKRRSFFNVPFRHLMAKPYVLTVEELATLFHLPGREAATPTLPRIPSKKAEAPSNLPI